MQPTKPRGGSESISLIGLFAASTKKTMQVRRVATGFAAACDSYWRTSPKFRPRHLAYYGCQMMPPCLLLFATLVLCGPVYAADAPRERLLMDFGWRFQNGDPSEVGTSLDYP